MKNTEVKFNINYEATIYPTELGWEKIRTIISEKYKYNSSELFEYMIKHRTAEGGYKDQLWQMMNNLGQMFFNGNLYLQHTTMELDCEGVKISKLIQ